MKQIYLDHAAATPTDPRVLQAMRPYFSRIFGNPSALYSAGREAQKALNASRKTAADILHCAPAEIIFTGSGTESDNLAILGAARANQQFGRHIITAKIEHHAVLHPCRQLEKEGFKITYLNADAEGFVSANQVLKVLTPQTILVSIMYANNEIGTIEPIAEIGNALRKFNIQHSTFNILFHTDACQAAGALDLDVNKLHADLMSLNGSKIYGPKGVGMLFKKRSVNIQPLISGGEQEFNLRAGTENVAGIVGFAKALELVQQNKEAENKRLLDLRQHLWEGIQKVIPKVKLNGSAIVKKQPLKRLPNNLNFTILDIEGEAMVLYLDEYGIQASTGSACSAQSLDPSHVILALGLPYEFAHGSLRLTLGHSTTKKDIDYVLRTLPLIVKKLREISPVNLNLKTCQWKHPRYK